jgi:prophage tail gpP-like protein
MSLSSDLTIAQLNPDGSVPVPQAPDAAANAAAEASQRAMRRVAMDLAAPQGVSEEEVVTRAMAYANQVLNTEDEDLGGSIAPAQLAHIARHKAFLRKQFR